MLTAGEYHTLTVSRITGNGIYLADAEGAEVLLPNRYVSLHDKVGDTKEVFIYHDSENRLIATTETPAVTAGGAAYLEVVDKNVHGAFMNWGITAKDLFVPNTNQTHRMEPGHRYVIFAYRDNVSGRLVGSTKLNHFVSNAEISVSPGQQVEILLAQRLPMGYRVIINNRHWGVLYDNQIFRPVELGDRMGAYVSKITEDNRIDVSLQQRGFDEVKNSAYKLMYMIKDNGGQLPLSDDSSPEQVRHITQMSKKVFKRSLGFLLSHGIVKQEEGKVVLVREVPER